MRFHKQICCAYLPNSRFLRYSIYIMYVLFVIINSKLQERLKIVKSSKNIKKLQKRNKNKNKYLYNMFTN